jgi:hypothetical protein
MARSTSFITGTGAVTATLLPSASTFLGVSAGAAKNAAAYYIKLYWEGTGTPPGGSTTLPAAGTSVPQLTIYVPLLGVLQFAPVPLNNGGRIWYWVSTNPAFADTTALATGGDAVTLIYD